ncbi:MAG TPA: hypothetical protein VIH61_03585 [Waddliaceae bacterium]
MKVWKKWVSLITATTIITSSIANLDGREYCTDAGGCAYEEAVQSCCMIPALTFAIVAIAGIIAVGVQNRGGHHSHSHAHSDSD